MLNNIFQNINIATNLLLLILLIFYFFYLRIKEKALNKKENKVDADYHKIIDDALTRERKIIDDTTLEANQIISGAQYISQSTKDAVDRALQQMVQNLQQGTIKTSEEFIEYYLTTLKQITHQSLGEFQVITKELEGDLEKQIKTFHDSLLPDLKKEVEAYRQSRLIDVDRVIKNIIQKVSREVLNKAIPLEDHEKLLIETLERAKAEGIFD